MNVETLGRTPRRVARVDLPVAAPLRLAPERASAVRDHFAQAQAANPRLWNGPFYLFDDPRIADGGFVAEGRATDFATFLEWRAGGYRAGGEAHVFPVAAVTTTDRRLLVGAMGGGTANAGLSYPPSGSFDPHDLVDGRLDPVANMVRELGEEAGLDPSAFTAEDGFTVIGSGIGRLALVKRFRAPMTAAELAAIIAAHLATDADPELAGFDFLPFTTRLAPERTVPYVNVLLSLLEGEA